jgi:hypothetical protein
MPAEPDPIAAGRCYLTDGTILRRVLRILPDGRVQYEWRGGARTRWKPGILPMREFAAAIDRSVPCDWTPETDE